MEYGIQHITRFRYHAPVSETVMEIRLHPRTEGVQRCLNFALSIQPEARGFAHQDYLGNIIDSFDIPVSHSELMITAEARVELTPPPALPDALDPDAWAALRPRAIRFHIAKGHPPEQAARIFDAYAKKPHFLPMLPPRSVVGEDS